ncbi:MAG TPA: cache domain-containing protein [Nitrospirota bacterium]|nr:cache domain-containing protein [Nitrospirota bacterium]
MKLNLKTRTIIPVQLILIVVMTGMAFFNYSSQVAVLNNDMDDTLNSALSTGYVMIDNNLNLYQQMATLVSQIPTLEGMFAKGDRTRLHAEMAPAFASLQKRFNLFQFQFHQPPATSFLRMNTPEKYGDDLSSFRHTVVSVNSQRKGVKGLEIGRTGIGLRGVEPISFKGQHYGSVEFGGDVLPVLENIKKTFGAEVGITLTQQAASIVFPDWQKQAALIGDNIPYFSTNNDLTQNVLSPDLFRRGAISMKGSVLVENTRARGRDYAVAISPLLDYSGQKIGFLYLVKDRTDMLNKIRKTLYINFAVYVTILVIVSWAIAATITRNVVRPVVDLTQTADDISMGKLGDRIDVEGAKDEIATLAKSIDRMRVSMKKLME